MQPIRKMILAVIGAFVLAGAALAESTLVLGDDGLHKQPFFFDSFLEMGPDLEEAAAEGKGLVVLWEQRGCPYCRELHAVNFARDDIVEFISEHFLVVQLDMWGSRAVTDFDGEEMEERDLARKWFVNFTPTTIIFPAEAAGATDIRQAEGFRMPGYFKPFHHLGALAYVQEGAFADQPFQRYLQARFDRMEEEGLNPVLWE